MRYAAVFLTLLIVACTGAGIEKTQVTASVENLTEFDDGYTKIANVAIKLDNTSNVPVFSFTIAVELETNRRIYYRTIYDDRGVPPHTVIWLTIDFAYIDTEEEAKLEDIRISGFYFE
jgi:hypothetical protein